MEKALAQVHWAARNDDVEALKKVLEEEGEDECGVALIDGADDDKRTPLHVAASHNSVTAAQLLLSAGAACNPVDRWNQTPLANAQQRGFKPMVKLLKQYGAETTLNSSDWLFTDTSEIRFDNSVLIGKGSFGEVRRATWRGTTVAVKTIKPSKSKSRGVQKDFLNEVELLVTLRHPNIVQFLAAATTKPPLMLITEYLPGGDLHALIRKGPLHADLATSFALDMARGMAYLHSGPNVVIHRDLKPRNLIIDHSNHLKVGDFGLSKLIQANGNIHEVYELTGETGSYRYMAPEVFLRKGYNAKVDVFSFAMILYEMFEGKVPFKDEADKEAAFQVAKDDRRPEFGSKTRYPEGMRELIMKCWSEFAVKRPPFSDIVQTLEKMQENRTHRDRHCFRHLLQRLHRRCHGDAVSEYRFELAAVPISSSVTREKQIYKIPGLAVDDVAKRSCFVYGELLNRESHNDTRACM